MTDHAEHDAAEPGTGVGDPASYATHTQRIVHELRESIFDGRLAPGSPVRQEAVAKSYGVSRIPVREALRQLEAEGLLVLRPHSGARVAMLDFEECIEVYKIRERLEPLAFSESVGRLSDEQLDAVRSAAAELERLTADPKLWLAGDRRFHLACYAGVATPRLLKMIEGLWNTTQQYRRVLLTTFVARDFALANAEHQLIIDALETNNARGGEEIVRIAMERSRLRLATHRQLFDH